MKELIAAIVALVFSIHSNPAIQINKPEILPVPTLSLEQTNTYNESSEKVIENVAAIAIKKSPVLSLTTPAPTLTPTPTVTVNITPTLLPTPTSAISPTPTPTVSVTVTVTPSPFVHPCPPLPIDRIPYESIERFEPDPVYCLD